MATARTTTAERRETRRAVAYLPGLDGVRAIAVIAVLAFHGGVPFAQGGFLGVSTFFTLSGFLITSLLIADARTLAIQDNPDRRGAIIGFWRRRVRRLLPASLVGIAMAVVFALFAGTVDQKHNIRGDTLGALLDVANWRFLFSQQSYGQIFVAPSPLQHYWSLAIEEQFYLVLPLVLIASVALFGATSSGIRRVLGTGARLGVRFPFALVTGTLLALSVVSTVVNADNADRVYYGTDTRAAELLIGCLLAVLLSGGGRVAEVGSPFGRSLARTLGPLALAVSIACWLLVRQDDSWLTHGGFVLYALLSAALVAGAAVPGTVSRLLAVKPLRWIGAISFGLYVYHWPIFLLLDSERTGLSLYPLLGLRVAVTVAIAMVSARWLERPIRAGDRPTWMPVRLRIVTPAFTAGIIVLALIAVQTAPAPTMDFEAAQAQFDQDLGAIDLAFASRAPSPVAATAAVAETPTKPPMGPVAAPWIAVFGDLSAKTMANILSLRQPDKQDAVYSDGIYDRSCSVLRSTRVRDVAGVHGNFEACDQRAETWPKVRATTGADVSLVSIGVQDLNDHDLDGSGTWRHIGDPEFDARVAAELDDTITTMASPESTTMLATIPTDWTILGADRPWMLTEPTYRERVTAMNAQITAAATRHPGVEILDADGWFNSAVGSGLGGTLTRDVVAAFGDWIAARAIEVNTAAAQRRYDAEPAPAAPSAIVGPGPEGTRPSGTDPTATGTTAGPGHRPPRVLIAGDSTAVALAVGLRGHAAVAGDIQVASVARLNCALAPGGSRRNGWAEQQDTCPDDTDRLRQAAQRFMPDVVVVSDVLWEVTDRKLPGDATWRTMGDPTYEAFLRERLNVMYDSLTSGGAHLALVLYPHIETGRGDATQPTTPYPANDPSRMDRWNDLLREFASSRPNASVIDLRSWLIGQPGGELDAGARPDGLHFNTDSGRAIADGFLATEITSRSPH